MKEEVEDEEESSDLILEKKQQYNLSSYEIYVEFFN